MRRCVWGRVISKKVWCWGCCLEVFCKRFDFWCWGLWVLLGRILRCGGWGWMILVSCFGSYWYEWCSFWFCRWVWNFECILLVCRGWFGWCCGFLGVSLGWWFFGCFGIEVSFRFRSLWRKDLFWFVIVFLISFWGILLFFLFGLLWFCFCFLIFC